MPGAGQEVVAGDGLLKLNPMDIVIEKLASEISKKILPTASIFILAVVVVILGNIKDSDPSFGVLAASTVGNVIPPSVERDIFTLAH